MGDFAFLQGALRSCGGLDIIKVDKSSTDVLWFMFKFGGLGTLFGGDKPTNPQWRRRCIAGMMNTEK